MPTTRLGFDVATAISVTGSDEVLVASTASGGDHGVDLAEQLLLEVEVLGHRLDHELAVGEVGEVAGEGDPACSASCSSWVSFPRLRARPVLPASTALPCSMPASSTSTAITSIPLRANTSTIPAPIVPSPITPTLVKSRVMAAILPEPHGPTRPGGRDTSYPARSGDRRHHPGCRAASRATGSPVVAGGDQLGLEGQPLARGQRRQADVVGGHVDLLGTAGGAAGRRPPAPPAAARPGAGRRRPRPGGSRPRGGAARGRSAPAAAAAARDGRAPGGASAAPARRAGAAGGRAGAAGAAARPRRTRSGPRPGRRTRFRAARRGTPSTALPALASPLTTSVRPRPTGRQRVRPTRDGRVVDRATRDRDVQRRLRRAADRPPAAGDPVAPGQGRRLGARALRRRLLQAAELDVAAVRDGRGRARRGARPPRASPPCGSCSTPSPRTGCG